MDIEQLKLILDTVGQAGEGAFWIAILWVLEGYFYAVAWVSLFAYAVKKLSEFLLCKERE